MIDQKDFYHGAALLQLLGGEESYNIRRIDQGFILNDRLFAYIKYTRRERPPWRFSITRDEVEVLQKHEGTFTIAIGLVCGGDGICCVSGPEVWKLISPDGGWLAAPKRI